MTMNKHEPYDDDFDPDFLPGDDDFDITTEADSGPSADATRLTAAWRRIEQRRDMAWLRDQTADWDYWDDYLQPQ